MKRTTLFVLLTAVHLAATIGLLMVVFGAGMGRFDTGGEPAWLEVASDQLLRVVGFPILTLLHGSIARRFSGWWGYVPFVANSAIWAAAGLGGLAIWRRRRGAR